jgi:hypothetical protein
MLRNPSFVSALVLALAALGAPGTAPAQEAPCTWDECALRVERGSLLEGARGTFRGRVIGLDLDVGVLSAGPDSAAAYAALFSRARPQSDLWSTFGDLGRGLALISWIHFALSDAADGWAWTAAALMPVSQVARSHARRQDVIANRSLERAVWWYNRQFAAPPAAPPAGRMLPLPADGSPWDLAPLAGGVLGGILSGLLFDDTGWIVTGVLLGTSFGDGVAERRLYPD